MSLPPRHAQLIRVDPCHPWFQNAIHQRSDELDANPRSVVSSSANFELHAPCDIGWRVRKMQGFWCAKTNITRRVILDIGRAV